MGNFPTKSKKKQKKSKEYLNMERSNEMLIIEQNNEMNTLEQTDLNNEIITHFKKYDYSNKRKKIRISINQR